MTIKSARREKRKDRYDEENVRESVSEVMTAELEASYDIRREESVLLPYEDLVPSRYNRDASTGLEELADDIDAAGQLQPIVATVQKENGKHVILVGERRWRAIGLLRDRYPDEKRFDFVKCDLIDAADDETRIMVMLNEQLNRKNPTPAEFRQMITALSKRFAERKESGETLGEKKAEYIKRMLGNSNLSDRQIRRYTTIVEKTIPEVQEAIDNGLITTVIAEAIAPLDEESQKLLADDYIRKGRTVDEKVVRKLKEAENEVHDLSESIKQKEEEIESLKKSLAGAKGKDPEAKRRSEEINRIEKEKKELIKKARKQITDTLSKNRKERLRKIVQLEASCAELSGMEAELTESEKNRLRRIIELLKGLVNE